MRTIRQTWILGAAIALLGASAGFAQDGAYMTPSKAAEYRQEQAKAQKERAAKLAEQRAKQKAEYDRILKEQEEVSDWYNRRDMTVTVEEMQKNLDKIDGKDSLARGGKYSSMLRRFNSDAVVLDNVDKVYVLNDMDYDPWTESYYGRDYGSGVNIVINTNPWGYYNRPYYGRYYGGYYGGWYDPWYYDAWAWRSPYFYPKYYPGAYYGWYDPWYDPFYYGIGSGAFGYGWGWGYPYGGYGYYGSYWNGYYDGAYFAGRNIRYNSGGRASGRYINGGNTYDNNVITRTRSADYGSRLGVTRDAVRTRTRAANTVYRDTPNYNNVNTRVNTRWNNDNGTVTRSQGTYSAPSRSTYSSPSRTSSPSRSTGGNSRTRR